MQPPRPFHGVPYDKDMFTFLPALANQDVLVESPRKRKSMASDSQTTISSPTIGYSPFGNLSPKVNAGDLRGNQSFVRACSPRKSSTFRNDSDYAKFGHQNDSSPPWHSNKMDFYDSGSERHGLSFAGQSQPSNHNDSPSLIQSPLGLSYKSNFSPLVTEHFNQHVSHDSNAHMVGEENGLHFPKTQSYGLQVPTSTKDDRAISNEPVNGESQKLLQNSSKLGVYIEGSNEKGCHEHSYKAETFYKSELGDSSTFARVDCTKMLGNSVGGSMLNLAETNSILQQALKLLQASSATDLTVIHDGSRQGCGGDAISIKPMPNPLTQNLSHSSINDPPSKGGETCLNFDKSTVSGDKDSVNIDHGLKSENGAEKLWDGTLKLSSSVTVSAVAFFKSGERMQDFSWSGSVDVKGKVRLEAFEKYVQDLPRSRTRGLMVMSLSGKEGSSAASLKSMMDVAKRYREGRRVGFAQLNKGLDMYVCPHSDTVITILAKHGFFKGLTAVSEKSDPLIGCVVWRKNSSSAPATETADVDTAHSEMSLIKQSDGNSDKSQTEIGVVKHSTENKIPETCVAPCIGQPEQSMTPENKLISVSEFHSNVDTVNPNSPAPLVQQSILLSDDEDLPEYDFGAVISQPSVSNPSLTVTVSPTPEMEHFRVSIENTLPIVQMRSESSSVSQTLTDPCYQEVPQNMNRQSETHSKSIQAQQEKQRERFTSLRTSNQGLAPCNKRHEPEMTIPSWAIEEKKSANDCNDTKKQRNLFDDDDDDMPEWCPPDLKKMGPEVNESPRPRPGPGPSMVTGFSFTDLATGRQLPSPPPLPPLPPPPALAQANNTTTAKKIPTENLLSLPPPPPPPLLPLSQRPLPPPLPLTAQVQSFDKNYLSVPHFPNQAVNALVHGNPDASMQYTSSAPSHIQFQPTHFPPLPPPPLPPTPHPSLNRAHISNNGHSAPHFSKPVVNNFIHNRPLTSPSHEWFQDQRLPPAPPLARPPPNKSVSHGPENAVQPVPPPNPGFRPQFDGRVNIQSHHSAWNNSRP